MVLFGDPAGDGETEAGTGAAARGVGLIEALEDTGARGRRDAGAVVRNTQLGSAV